jgi:hypothetical protein
MLGIRVINHLLVGHISFVTHPATQLVIPSIWEHKSLRYVSQALEYSITCERTESEQLESEIIAWKD